MKFKFFLNVLVLFKNLVTFSYTFEIQIKSL